MVNVKESAPESEGMKLRLLIVSPSTNSAEQKFKQKCSELRKRILEVEESNEISTIALSRTRLSIRRLRLEHSILLERLENQFVKTYGANELMSQPPDPTLWDDAINLKVDKNGGPKTKKGKPLLSTNGTTKKTVRDPDLPKRPTNAYLMFCEREKEKLRNQLTTNNSGKNTSDLTKILTDTWKGLDEEQKKPFQELYEEDRERYKREMEEYNKKKQDQNVVSSSANQSSASKEDSYAKHPSVELENNDLKRQRVEASFDSHLEVREIGA